MEKRPSQISRAGKLLQHTPIPQFFNLMATQLKAEEIPDEELAIQIRFTDVGDNYLILIKNAVLHHRLLDEGETVVSNATINISHAMLIDIMIGNLSAREIIFSDQLSIDGSKLDLLKFFGLLDQSVAAFNIVTP